MKQITLILLSLIVFNSCTDDFEELNRNKTASTTIDPELLFTRSLVTGSGMSYTIYQFVNQTQTSHWAQHWTNINPGFIGDNYGPEPANNVWEYYYSRKHFAPLMLSNEVMKLIREGDNNPVKYACADIWNVYLFSLMTDMFGNIPYSDAFNTESPAYDNQDDIYKDLLKRLKESSSSLIENTEKGYKAFGEGDVLFEGDVDKWQRFANTLILRLSIRVSGVDNALAGEYLSSLDINKLISTNDENVQLMTVPASQAVTDYVKNPMGYIYTWNEVRISKTLMDWLNGNNTSGVIDPRMHQYAEANANGEYVGLPSGQDPLDLRDQQKAYRSNYCNIGPFYNHQQESMPIFLMTAAEANFLLAEARLQNLVSGGLSAEAYYLEGIRKSMEQFEVSGDVNPYLNANNVKYEQAKALEMIITQKWIALYANGLEAWNELRRTGFPAISPLAYYYPGNNDMPRRFIYSTAEASYNTENYNKAAANMGGDTQYSRMWWDAN
ncbi:MAG: SusD/RagB family nutrient-binding outer membrane lipoprotein [Carboxylicivirga sp.]|nr:SusD/RagB family nutrient-binding outer membrane lipoprotein [Carboxylicivirga sp.]